ncbi:iron ABC transporter permease [Ureaplasma canigenitalium]|uniref:iron ABC transporter permease n=1 Tax=Ureaplasma canigenitalium TaxID=42092 RepID=UPI000690B077|nr:iron ABC transporter permease [Ureaplasma canigenitalium]
MFSYQKKLEKNNDNNEKIIDLNFEKKKKRRLMYQSFILVVVGLHASMFFLLYFFYDKELGISLEAIQRKVDQIERGRDSALSAIVLEPVGVILSGIALSFAGFSMQIVSRNPLSGPTTLGYLPAAILGLAVSSLATGAEFSLPIVLGVVFAGSLIVINFFMIKGKIFEAGFKPILVGFAIGGMITGVNFLLKNYVNELRNANIANFVGNPLSGRPVIQDLYYTTPLILCSAIAVLAMSPYYQIMSKDILLAKTLGIKINLVFWMTAIFAVISTVSSIILVGVVTLIGLVAPHIARIINPRGSIWQNLFLSFFVSWFFVSTSKWLGRFQPAYDINFLSSILAMPVFFYIFSSKRFAKHVE